jgi:Zn-dependent peptidase ImmA (M78 family)
MSNESITKIANLIIEKEGINNFPIDIDAIARKYANIRYIDIPFDFDGITLKERKKRPQIIINTTKSIERQRFTLAHELGHIIIPWHIGIILDKNIHADDYYEDHEYKGMEVEANQFAAELLLPTEFLKDYISKTFNPGATDIGPFIENLASRAHTSLIATTLKVFNNLPSNYMYVIVDNDDNVIYSGKSKGTIPKNPDCGDSIDISSFFTSNSKRNIINTSNYQFIYVYFPRDVEVKISDNTDWRSILSLIINNHFIDDNDKKHNYTSVNSRIGALYGSDLSRKTIEFKDFYHSILERIQGYPDLDWLLKHEYFSEFILRKATDLYNKYLMNR